jgi:hypothetical protein
MTTSFFRCPLSSAASTSAREAITLPRVVSDLLIFPPSRSRVPVAPEVLALSLPAKSTNLILEDTIQDIPEARDFLYRGLCRGSLYEPAETNCEHSMTSRRRIVHQGCGSCSHLQYEFPMTQLNTLFPTFMKARTSSNPLH